MYLLHVGWGSGTGAAYAPRATAKTTTMTLKYCISWLAEMGFSKAGTFEGFSFRGRDCLMVNGEIKRRRRKDHFYRRRPKPLLSVPGHNMGVGAYQNGLTIEDRHGSSHENALGRRRSNF